jgi:serine/threonine protein kinase
MAEALTHNLKLIGRYSILRELRRDRYTVAYLAFDPVLNRELILKAVQLRPPPGQEATGHDRIDQAFMRQAQAAGRLHHPHIVTVFDAGRIHNIGYLALERVDGKLLDEALAGGFRPGFLQAADITARVADAIEYAHARGIPHGHLGTSRIFLQGPERSPKVMGFGGWIDTGATGDFELSATEVLLPYFENELSPEARRNDIRALGALLHLLLTGMRPDMKALRERRSGESVIVDLRPSAPLALAEIAESALEVRNLRPFGTAGQMRNALTTYLWGTRDAHGLPNVATITGTPGRLEITPSAATLAVPTVDTASRPGRAPGRRTNRLLGLGAVGAAALAMAAIASTALRGASDTGRIAPERAPPGVAASTAIPAPAVNPAPPSTAKPSPEPAARSSAQTTRFGSSSDGAMRTSGISPARQGIVELAVAPWGEVFVNGRAQGTTPPLQHLTLPAGHHTIELRNGDRQPYIAQVDVAPDRAQQITYRFQ